MAGSVELHFIYDEEFGGVLGPAWLLAHGLTHPDFVLAAGFSYAVVTAHNGRLQLEVTVRGRAAHAAFAESGVDALEAATAILVALYVENERNRAIVSQVPGITHPWINVGWIAGGTNTNVVPGSVVLRLDRRTSTCAWTACAAPPRSWRARCTTCSPTAPADAPAAGLTSLLVR